MNKMRKALESAAREFQTHVDIETEMIYPGFRFTEEELVTQKALAAVKRIGRLPRLLSSGGGSDANIFSGYGVPTINLAIGYEEIHTTSERIPLEELFKAAELVVALTQEALQ
jgi:tripeptide aminopeptidase